MSTWVCMFLCVCGWPCLAHHYSVCVCACLCGRRSYSDELACVLRIHGLGIHGTSSLLVVTTAASWVCSAEFMYDFIWLLSLPHHYRCCSRLRWQQGCTLHKFFWLIHCDAWCTDRIRMQNLLRTDSLCALAVSLLHMFMSFWFLHKLAQAFSEWILYLFTRALVAECIVGLPACAVVVGSAAFCSAQKTASRGLCLALFLSHSQSI